MQMISFFFLFFVIEISHGQEFDDDPVDLESQAINLNQQLQQMMTESVDDYLRKTICDLVSCNPDDLALNLATLFEFDWEPVSIVLHEASAPQVATSGAAVSPGFMCSDDLMVGNYIGDNMSESNTEAIDECCAKTSADFPKWSWRIPETDGGLGTCRVWPIDAEVLVTDIMDDFQKWIENNNWFSGETHTTQWCEANCGIESTDCSVVDGFVNCLCKEGFSDITSDSNGIWHCVEPADGTPTQLEETLLHCERVEAQNFLDRDVWSRFDKKFFTTYKNIVESVVDPTPDEDAAHERDELINLLWDAMNLREDFIARTSAACSDAPDLVLCLEQNNYDMILDIYDDAIEDVITRIELVSKDPIVTAASKISNFEHEGGICLATGNGILSSMSAASWILSKSPQEVKESLENSVSDGFSSSWNFDITLDRFRSSDLVGGENLSAPFEFQAVLEIGAIKEILVHPGDWYDPSFWENLHNLENSLGDLPNGYSVCPKEGKFHIFGEGGLLQSMITRIYVANEFSLQVAGTYDYVYEFDGIVDGDNINIETVHRADSTLDVHFRVGDGHWPRVIAIHAPRFFDQYCTDP